MSCLYCQNPCSIRTFTAPWAYRNFLIFLQSHPKLYDTIIVHNTTASCIQKNIVVNGTLQFNHRSLSYVLQTLQIWGVRHGRSVDQEMYSRAAYSTDYQSPQVLKARATGATAHLQLQLFPCSIFQSILCFVSIALLCFPALPSYIPMFAVFALVIDALGTKTDILYWETSIP